MLESNVRRGWDKNPFFLCRNLSLISVLLIRFKTVDSSERFLSNDVTLCDIA